MERCVYSLWCKLHHDRKFVLLFESTNVDIEEYDDGIGWGVGNVCSPMPSSSMSTIRYCLSTMCHFHLSVCVCSLLLTTRTQKTRIMFISFLLVTNFIDGICSFFCFSTLVHQLSVSVRMPLSGSCFSLHPQFESFHFN